MGNQDRNKHKTSPAVNAMKQSLCDDIGALNKSERDKSRGNNDLEVH